MRRVQIAIAAVVLALAFPAATHGAAPFRADYRERSVGCSASSGGVEVWLDVSIWEDFLSGSIDTTSFLSVWLTDPGTTFWSDPWGVTSMVFDSTGVEATIPLTDGGVATLVGGLSEPVPYSDESTLRDGNTWTTWKTSGTFYAFDGTLSLPGLEPLTLNADSCRGVDLRHTTIGNQPNAIVRTTSDDGYVGFCGLSGGAGISGSAILELDPQGYLSMIGTASDGSGRTVYVFGAADVPISGTTPFEVTELDANEEVPPATVSMALTLDDAGTIHQVSRGLPLDPVNGSGPKWSVAASRTDLIEATGEIPAATIGAMALGDCLLERRWSHYAVPMRHGAGPGGLTPDNDLPSGAPLVQPGFHETISTRGAAMASEAAEPCVFETIFGAVEIQPEYTVWYAIAATGDPVTVDTTRSGFATMIAVYPGTPDAAPTSCAIGTTLEPVGFSPQTVLTFATEPDTVYWIQIGGLPMDAAYGILDVSIE